MKAEKSPDVLIASFMLWLAGLVAKEKKLHYTFQANSLKSRNFYRVVGRL
ncbi:hypothetical protein [Vibrio pectenicida]|nr:hypothetical protein [Vibrio pectenicida]